MPDLLHATGAYCRVLLALLCAAAALNLRSLRAALEGVPRSRWAALAAVCAVGAALRFLVAPHQPYTFFDEYEHIDAARSLAEAGVFGRCDFRLGGTCLSYWLPQWPPAWHFLLSLAFRLAGPSEAAAYACNALVGSATIPLAFLAAAVLLEDSAAGLGVAALTALLPLHVRLSGGASPEVCSMALMALTALAAGLFLRAPGFRPALLLACAACWAFLARAENVVLAAPLALLLVGAGPKGARYAWPLLVLALAPALLYLPGARDYYARFAWPLHGGSGLRLLAGNISYWFAGPAVPTTLALAAAWGALRGGARSAWLWLWFLALEAVYAFVQRADLWTGDAQRLNLQMLLPVLLLAASGLRDLLSRPVARRAAVLGTAAALLAADLGARAPFVSRDLAGAQERRDYLRLGEAAALPRDCVFATYSPPSVITRLGRDAVHVRHLLDDELVRDKLGGRCLVLVDDRWCREDPEGFCASARKRYGDGLRAW